MNVESMLDAAACVAGNRTDCTLTGDPVAGRVYSSIKIGSEPAYACTPSPYRSASKLPGVNGAGGAFVGVTLLVPV